MAKENTYYYYDAGSQGFWTPGRGDPPESAVRLTGEAHYLKLLLAKAGGKRLVVTGNSVQAVDYVPPLAALKASVLASLHKERTALDLAVLGDYNKSEPFTWRDQEAEARVLSEDGTLTDTDESPALLKLISEVTYDAPAERTKDTAQLTKDVLRNAASMRVYGAVLSGLRRRFNRLAEEAYKKGDRKALEGLVAAQKKYVEYIFSGEDSE